jgi:hypothetical protein
MFMTSYAENVHIQKYEYQHYKEFAHQLMPLRVIYALHHTSDRVHCYRLRRIFVPEQIFHDIDVYQKYT